MPTALSGLQTTEVSLVTRGAVNKRFAIKKEESSAMDQILKAVLEQEAEGEGAALVQLAKSDMSDKGREAMRGVIRILSAFKDEIPSDVAKAAAKMAGFANDDAADYSGSGGKKKAPFNKATGDDSADADADSDDDDEDDDDDDSSQAPAQSKKPSFPPKTTKRKKTSTLRKEDLPQHLQEHFETLSKAHDEAVEKADRLEREVAVERDARLKKEFIEKAAKDHKDIGSASEVGLVLKDLHGLDAKLAARVEKIFKDASARIDSSKLFGQIGKDASMITGGGTDAWSRICQEADRLVQKSSDIDFTVEAARAMVMERNKDLYNQYIAERRERGLA